MRLIDILPKIPQYEDIPYTPDFECPNCGKTGFFDYNWGPKHEKPNLIGWTETNIGKMAVFECPLCGQKFRFHCTIGTWIADDDEFDYYLYDYAMKSANEKEIARKMEEEIKNKMGDEA